MRSHKWKLILAVLMSLSLILLLTQCTIGNPFLIITGQKIWFYEITSSSSLKKQIHEKFVNRSINDAKRVMEINDFKCGYKGIFDIPGVWNLKRTSQNSDYLLCNKSQSISLACDIEYEVTFFYEKEAVARVDALVNKSCSERP